MSARVNKLKKEKGICIGLIIAQSLNGCIGLNGAMPWENNKEDMANFVKLSKMFDRVVVGRRTFETLPVLKGRQVNVITSSMVNNEEFLFSAEYRGKVNIFESVEALFEDLDVNSKIAVIGGAVLYRQFIDIADMIYCSSIERVYNGDTYFNVFKHLKEDMHIVQSVDQLNSYTRLYTIANMKGDGLCQQNKEQ